MTNLKKTLAVVLAFAMILSMGFSAFAYTDVAEGTKVSEAVGILSNLGILTGFEDGTFKPDETVTRAQMAAIICRTLGYEDQAKSSAGSTIFNDVAADHWAAGYINVAQSLQIINGYGDGNYGPEDQVTYEQAVKMIVVALGYELDAQAKGGWSTGYLAVASREGITKNANGTVGSPASRGTIAVLVYNSLEVRLMDQETWTTTGGQDEYAKTDETILSQYLDVQKWEGVVYSVPFKEYASGYTADSDVMMQLRGTDSDNDYKPFYQEYEEGKLKKYYAELEAVDCSLVADVNDMSGKKVVAYIGAEEDDETGNRMVYAIAEKQGANKVTVISANQLTENGDSYYTDPDIIGYRNVGSSKINTLDLDKTVSVTVNFKDASTVTNTKELAAHVAEGGIITLISNDANSKIDVIRITKYDEEAVIEAVNNEEGMITFDVFAGTIDDIDTEDEDVLNVVIKDGVVATVADITANDTVSIVNVAGDESFMLYYVSSKTVTGAVESYDDDVVEIAGEEYELSSKSDYTSTEDLSGKEGIFFLNVDGQIAHDEAEASKGNYAVVLAAGTTTGLGGGFEIEVVLADGTSATYPLGDKAYIEGVNDGKKYMEGEEEKTRPAKGDDTTYTALQKNLTENKKLSTYEAMYEQVEKNVFELTVKNGKVTKLVPLTAAKSDVSGKDYDAENMSYGAISFDEATVVISVEGEAGVVVEADDVVVGKVADFMVDGEGDEYSLSSYDVNNNDIAGLVIGKNLTTTVPEDSAAVIITSVKTREIDTEIAYVVSGMQAGKEVTYTIYDEEDDFTGDVEDLAKGSVILVGVANAEGMVSDFKTLFTVADGIKTYNDVEDEIYHIAGIVNTGAGEGQEDYAPTNNKFFFTTAIEGQYMDGEEKKTSDYYSEEDGITMRNAASYTLVDYSDSQSNPEVDNKSKSKSLFGKLSGDNADESYAFVRYYDDTLVEVIVYRNCDALAAE